MSAIVNALFGNWKTTLGGLVGACGAYLMTQPGGWAVLGQILAPLGVFIVGAAGKDSTTGSQAKPAP